MKSNEMRKKIFCLERQKADFDDVAITEIQEMTGFVCPTDGGKWDINLIYDECYTCDRQTDATIIASLEEIKAMLIKLLEKD